MKSALIVWGGWEGHEPEKGAALFAAFLQEQGYEVEVATTLDVYLDSAKMHALDLVVPIWTMSTITVEQEKGLLTVVQNGVGIAGWHGCMADFFGITQSINLWLVVNGLRIREALLTTRSISRSMMILLQRV